MTVSESLLKDLISIRRTLHENPEIGYQEFETSKLVAAELERLKIPFEAGVADTKTGIVASLKKGEGPCILLRADIDALPIGERTGLSFASRKENTMHACGHDVHTTMLLGAAHLLQDQPFEGEIRLVFQPSEEGCYDDPEGKSGGHRIADSEALDNVAAALALHVHPLLETGKISYARGQALGCATFFVIEVTGRSGHAGAAPHLAIDAILVAANIVQNVQSIISRNISPTSPAVISITTIHGGEKENIIADKVIMKGTIRALDIATYEAVVSRLKELLRGIGLTFGATIDFRITLEYPSLLNDDKVHEMLRDPLNAVFGEKNVLEAEPMLAGEDFAFYSRKAPSMFYFIGARDTAEEAFFVHHPSVIVNEDCIPLGAAFLASGALRLLEECRKK